MLKRLIKEISLKRGIFSLKSLIKFIFLYTLRLVYNCFLLQCTVLQYNVSAIPLLRDFEHKYRNKDACDLEITIQKQHIFSDFSKIHVNTVDNWQIDG